jgi:hypothetical protein
VKKLILVTVDTNKDDAFLEDMLAGELTLKLRPFVPGDTAELVKLKALKVKVVATTRDFLP